MLERIRTVDLNCGKEGKSFSLDIDLSGSSTILCPFESSDTQHANVISALTSRLIGPARAKIDVKTYPEKHSQVRVRLRCSGCKLNFPYLFEE